MDEEKKDLNTEEESAEDAGQSEKESEEEKDESEEKDSEEETLDSLPSWAKTRLEKAESDRDNYKAATLSLKKEPEKKEEEQPDVKKIAEETAMAALDKRTEKDAISQFTSKYPALKDSTRWKEILANYVPRHGKSTVEEITRDLEGALVLANHYAGRNISDSKNLVEDVSTVGKKGSKADRGETSNLNESTIEMGKRFKHTPEQLAKEDDSSKAEIKL